MKAQEKVMTAEDWVARATSDLRNSDCLRKFVSDFGVAHILAPIFREAIEAARVEENRRARAWKLAAKECRKAFLQAFESYQDLGREWSAESDEIIGAFGLEIELPVTNEKLIAALRGHIRDTIAVARFEEREACAKVAENVYEQHLAGNPLVQELSTPGSMLEAAARLIRARAQGKE